MTIIETIRAEIERRIKKREESYVDNNTLELKNQEDWDIIEILDTLQEQPVDLEKEIKETFDKDITTLKSFGAYSRFARHFYELGRQSKDNKLGGIARHILAVKDHLVDMRLDDGEIELLKELGYPERKEQEEPVCEGLEEEIDKRWKEWISEDKEQVEGVLPKSEFAFYARHFAKWGAEHLKK